MPSCGEHHTCFTSLDKTSSVAGMQVTMRWVCRSKFNLVVEKCWALCDWVDHMGPGTEVEAQDAMARLTLDIVLRAGFGIASNTIGDRTPVPLLTELHYAMDESFRHVYLPRPFCPYLYDGQRTSLLPFPALPNRNGFALPNASGQFSEKSAVLWRLREEPE